MLLPFTLAWSEYISQPELGEKVTALYHHYPALAVNSVEKHMRSQLGLDRRLVNSARRQQGLLHVYRTLCTRGRCQHCGLGQLEARHDIQVQASRLSGLKTVVAAGGNHGGVIGAQLKGRD